MDAYIENGEIVTDVSGYPRTVYGVDEACQRALLILSTQKGAFIYDREFGTDWRGIMENFSDEEVLLRCKEALADEGGISVLSARLDIHDNIKTLDVTIGCAGQIKSAEVRVNV